MESTNCDLLLQDVDHLFPEKAFLTIEDVAKLLNCSTKVIYNWTKRADIKKRPPKVIVGKALRFPKRDLVMWLMKGQGSSGKEV